MVVDTRCDPDPHQGDAVAAASCPRPAGLLDLFSCSVGQRSLPAPAQVSLDVCEAVARVAHASPSEAALITLSAAAHTMHDSPAAEPVHDRKARVRATQSVNARASAPAAATKLAVVPKPAAPASVKEAKKRRRSEDYKAGSAKADQVTASDASTSLAAAGASAAAAPTQAAESATEFEAHGGAVATEDQHWRDSCADGFDSLCCSAIHTSFVELPASTSLQPKPRCVRSHLRLRP
jgi:hypothetical protein